MGSAQRLTHFRFGKWLVAPQECRVESEEGSRHIEPKLMDVLVYLCERAGVVVSTEELLIALWRGTFYGDNPVHRSIALLRRVLGDDATRPTHIATIRKRGYQVVGPVSFPTEYAPAASAISTWAAGSPYPGLAPFRAEQQHVFFGRSLAQATFLARLRARVEKGRGFMLVLGASGCGKSSLMRAGILPLLQQAGGFDGLHALAVADLEPRRLIEDPCVALIDAMLQWHVGADVLFHPTEREWLADALHHDRAAVRNTLAERMQRRTHPVRSTGYRPFVLFTLDQMERVFSEGERGERAVDWVFTAVGELLEDGGMAMLAGCRNDFYPQLMQVAALVALKDDGGQFDLPALASGDIALAIRSPALAAGLTFEQEDGSSLRLDDVLRDDAVLHPQSLPLLQHALSLLYEQRTPGGLLTFAAYRAIGGVAGALAQQAESAHAMLSPAAQASLPDVLRQLIALDDEGRSLVGRQVPWPEDRESGAVELVRCFIEQRLFVSELDAGKPVYSAAHESLFRHWPRISKWVDDNRRLLQQRSRLSVAHHRWIEEGERRDFLLPHGSQLDEALGLAADRRIVLDADEHRFIGVSARRSRAQWRLRIGAITTMLVLGILAGIAGIIAMIQQREAADARGRAESLVGFMLGDLAESLRPIGKLDLLDAVSTEVTRYMSSVPADPGDVDALLLRERALRQVGEIHLERGNVQGARDVFAQAATMAQWTAERHPEHADAWLGLGNAVFWQGQVSYRLGDYAAAARSWNAYLDAARRLVERRPGDAPALLELSYAHNNLATLAFREGQLVDAKRELAASLVLKADALALTPGDAGLRADMADTLTWRGSIAEAEGDLEGAEDAYRGAVGMLGELERAHPDDQRWRYRRAVASMHLAATLLSRGRAADAATLYADAETVLRVLAAIDPDNVSWVRDGIYATANLGWTKHLLGEKAEATRLARAALVQTQALLATHGATADYRRLVAVVHLRAAHATPESAQDGFETLSADIERLSAVPLKWGKNAKSAHLLAELLVSRAVLHADSGRQRDADSALTLLDSLESTSGSLAVIDLKARALLLGGRPFEASPCIERLARAGYRNPAFDVFLRTHQKDSPWPLSPMHRQIPPRLSLN